MPRDPSHVTDGAAPVGSPGGRAMWMRQGAGPNQPYAPKVTGTSIVPPPLITVRLTVVPGYAFSSM